VFVDLPSQHDLVDASRGDELPQTLADGVSRADDRVPQRVLDPIALGGR
jgi:hypothetical protein